MKTILVAVDGSYHAELAVSTAAEIAAGLDATLLLVTIDIPGTLKGKAAELAHSENIDRLEVANAFLQSARIPAEKAGVKNIETDISSGDAAEGIIQAADKHKADMIVLGARGLSKLEDLVLGSVSHKVLHLAHRPCLIVRE